MKYLGHLFRYRRHNITLLPVNHIKVQDGYYESTGVDPQFELVTNRKTLPRRWVFISYKASDLDDILAPSLYYSKGNGFFEHDVVHLPDKTPGQRCLIRLPYNLKALRLDPADKPGRFMLSDIRCVEVGLFPLLLILSWREIARGGKTPGAVAEKLLKGAGFLFTRGPLRAREYLLARHQRCINKRVIYDYTTARLPTAPEAAQWEEVEAGALSGSRDGGQPGIDVIVPVYKGYDETLNCIYAVLRESNKTAFNLVVINDRSPDGRLAEKLRELSGRGLFELHENKANVGFVKTVNIGMRLNPGRDVVLLNSDTEVYNDWLDRLRKAAYRERNIGTVTPFSNNAEICSYPYNTHDNNMQLEVSYSELDTIAAECNAGRFVEIPTGVGFCMYIRRDCLDDTGLFDEEGFGAGYGEENDFCLRAANKGWSNVLAADIFVRHVGGSSFGAEKQERVLNAIRVINRRFPGYDRAIRDFLYEDPVIPYRKNIDIARLRQAAQGKVFLFVSHNWGGGTERHIQDMAAQLRKEGVQICHLRPNPENGLVANIHCPEVEFLPNLPVLDFLYSVDKNAAALREFGFSHVHIHSLAGFSERVLAILPEVMQLAGLRYDVTLHDYMTICPRIHLCDDVGRYCEEPRDKLCNACISRHGTPFGRVEIKDWRSRNRSLLLNARKVYSPNEDVSERMLRHYPDIQLVLRPHPELPVRRQDFLHIERKPGEAIRVGIVGAISAQKGSGLLMKCARDAQERHLPLRFVVIGYTNLPELGNEPNVEVTGAYQEAEITGLISRHRIHVIFFPAATPETYSYTLSIALRAGFRPIAFDIGAVGRRLKKIGYGDMLLPTERSGSPAYVNDFLINAYAVHSDAVVPDVELPCYGSLLEAYYAYA